MTDEISPAYLASACDPEWHRNLSACAKLRLRYRFDLWVRPDQYIPTHKWRTCGFTGGRGFGKTMVVSRWINARVRAGRETELALMAPTEPRVDEVCFKSLINYADPDFIPERFSRKGQLGIRWPNGVEAIGFTPEREGRARGGNPSLAWCTEVVDWKASTRLDAFRNLDSSVRTGRDGGRIIWDSTAKGRNDVRTLLEEWHEMYPRLHVIVPGTMFDNPLLDSDYLRGQWRSYAGVRREEELFGASFRESAGALWKQAWLDRTRVAELPATGLEWTLVTCDPATTSEADADETGIAVGGRGRDGHAYLLEDLSGHHTFEQWGELVVERAHPAKRGAGRIGIERKRIGEGAFGNIKARAETRGLRVRLIGKDEPWPAWDPACLFVREYSPQESKGTRAEGPAAETEAGRVHLVDPEYPERPAFADLEKELTTFVQGVTKRSPNRLDAFAYLVSELRELWLNSPPDYARDAALAAAMNAELQTRLRGGSAAAVAPAGVGVAANGLVAGGRRMGL